MTAKYKSSIAIALSLAGFLIFPMADNACAATTLSNITHPTDIDLQSGTYFPGKSVWPNDRSVCQGADCPSTEAEPRLIDAKSACAFGETSVQTGQSVQAFSSALAPLGGSCASIAQMRSCGGDVLSGNSKFKYPTCTADALNQQTLLAPRWGADTSIISISDGTLLMMRAAQDAKQANKGASRIWMERSADNGQTWQMLKGAAPYPATSVDGVRMLQLDSGRILATYHLWTPHPERKASEHTLEAMFSDDKGIHWTHLATVDSITVPRGSLGTGVWETFLVQPKLRPGIVQVYYARERDDAEVCTTHPAGLKKGQDIAMKESGDGGQTWGPLHIVLRNGKSREGVPSVAETPDGALFLAHEHQRFGGCDDKTPQAGFLPGIAMSTDGGVTWKELAPAYHPADNFILAGWPQIIRLQDGRFAVRFATGVLSNKTRNIDLVLTTNTPSLTEVPVWEKAPIQVMNSSQQAGALAQAQNGDLIVTGSTAFLPQNYRTLPLSTLPTPGR